MMTKEQAKQLADQILSYSKLPECSITINEDENAFIRFANNGVTTSGFTVERTVTISSTKDGRTGSTSISDLEASALKSAVALTEQLASITPPNQEHVEPLGPQTYASLDHFDEATAQARSPQMVPHLRSVISAALEQKLVAAGFFERSAGISAIANKRGNFGYSRATDARLSTTVRAADGSSSGWAAQPSVRIRDISGADLAARAVGKCKQWSSPRRLDPGRYTVVLEPTAVADLLQLIAFSFQARAAEEGRSFLSKKGGGTQLGAKLFPDNITLRTDPSDARFPSSPWTFGGLPNRTINWIEKGVVKSLAYDRYWAQKANQPPTPQPNSLVLEGGDASLEQLIAKVPRGLLVTRFWYLRLVNPQTVQVTGLTRDGLFLIEDGKVTAPVMNFRFNESPVRLLQNARAFGVPQRARGAEGSGMIVPPLVVDDFPFTSVSDAV